MRACPSASPEAKCMKDTNAPHSVRLLRPRRQRPRRRAAEQRDELPPLHSITSSARASNDAGRVEPEHRARSVG